jgi:predicted TIM-barrel fold metal-dependent hydrolase
MTATTSSDVFAGIKVIDTDTHVIEPPDLWTSRLSVQRWGDRVPHVRWDEASGEESWFFGDKLIYGAATPAMAFWHEYPPDHPKRLADADPSTWDASRRLAKMDEFGIWAQVLYPNVAGFGTGRFLEVGDAELMIACVRAYNDYLVDFASIAPDRFVPVAAVPFWDVDLSVQEIRRAAAIGHKGIMFGNQPEAWGAPDLTSRHWDPIWAVAQELELSINFHIAAGDVSGVRSGTPEHGERASFASFGVQFFLGNATTIAKLVCGGICHRFPRLNFVSVESGIGWIPFALASLDWQWKNCAVTQEHPEYDLLPSEYFRRQIYGCFWFEQDTALQAIELLGPDNVLYETDFPHPTSMTPGPATFAQAPRDYANAALGTLPPDSLRKILHDNAARIYHLD